MAEINEYKCPACGGAMEFDTKSQSLKCPYCDTVVTTEEYEKLHNDQEKQTEESWTASGDGSWSEGETEGIKVYTCNSCGGEIIADDTTGASVCPYCGNKVLMKNEFKGDLRPDFVIPFKFDKKQAKQAYLNHLKTKIFLPKVFRSENHIDEIRGVYVPFWLFDVNANGNASYKAEKLRVWTNGKKEYTEHNYYEVLRGGSMSFECIPEDGSEKMDDTLMEAVEPFNFDEAVPFSTAYLAGYMADRYDVKAEERIERARERVQKSLEEQFRKTVQGYDIVTCSSCNINTVDAKYKYALYPVWILNTNWKDEKYVFAMNGQTGKLVGDLPTDKGLFFSYIAKWGAVFSAATLLILFAFNLIF